MTISLIFVEDRKLLGIDMQESALCAQAKGALYTRTHGQPGEALGKVAQRPENQVKFPWPSQLFPTRRVKRVLCQVALPHRACRPKGVSWNQERLRLRRAPCGIKMAGFLVALSKQDKTQILGKSASGLTHRELKLGKMTSHGFLWVSLKSDTHLIGVMLPSPVPPPPPGSSGHANLEPAFRAWTLHT